MNIPTMTQTIMNIKEKKRVPFYKRITTSPYIFYLGFIIVASIFCILLAEISPNHKLRTWYYNLMHKPVIDKAVQYTDDKHGILKNDENFLTYYRFHEFGESNPGEVDANAAMIALTFDDGPNPSNTQRILDVLNANYSHATFFVVGTNAEKYQDTLKAISASGCEIGNHSYSHTNLMEISSSEVEEEIDKVNRAVKKATGENTTVIRPPYGAFDDDLLGRLEEPVVLWDLDTEDWDSRDAQKIAEAVLSNVKDGDIVLMHDIYESTAEAVEIIVPKLKEQGYQIVTVSEMAQYKGEALELGKAYGRFAGAAQ